MPRLSHPIFHCFYRRAQVSSVGPTSHLQALGQCKPCDDILGISNGPNTQILL